MSPGLRHGAVLAGVVLAVAAVVALRPARVPPAAVPVPAATPAAVAGAPASPPRLLELGSATCVPCRMMEPVLAGLRADYPGVLAVEAVDVRADPAAGQRHRIATIPTQLFLAPDGRELARHEGFIPREEILATWRRLGYDLGPAGGGGR